MKKITHISKPEIFSPLLKLQIGRKPTTHVQPKFCKYTTQEVGILTSVSTTDTCTVLKGE